MHLVTSDNYQEAEDAVRDILMMYVDMAHAYEGFGHASDCYIHFDRLKFVDAKDDGKAAYVDMDLLRAGSAIAILCVFYDFWCEEQQMLNPHTKGYEAAITQGRLGAFSDIENVLKEVIGRKFVSHEDEWFEGAVAPIYRKYVQGYFKALGQKDRLSS